MDRRRSRWTVRLVVVFLVALAVAAYALWGRTQQLTVENRSGQTISDMQVIIAGASTSYQDIAPGRSVSLPSSAWGQKQFEVEGRLADGTRIKAQGVLREPVHLIVLPGGQIQIKTGRRG